MIKVEIMPESDLLAILQARLRVIGSGSMPATTLAFKQSANILESKWKSYAMGAPIEGEASHIKHPTGGYAAGVKVRSDGPFDYTVYNDSIVAGALENGTPQLDMKTTHPYGEKSRVANHGTAKNPHWVPYLIVPFRWGTPGAVGHFRNIIPEQIYAMLQLQMKTGVFARTKVAPTSHTEPNFWGDQVQRAEYTSEDETKNWGSVLRGVGGNLEGMSVFSADTAKKRSSTYFTFRVVSAESPEGSWIKPPTPALHIAQHVADTTRNVVEEMIQNGLHVDLGVA